MGNFAENLNLGNRFRPPPELVRRKYHPLFWDRKGILTEPDCVIYVNESRFRVLYNYVGLSCDTCRPTLFSVAAPEIFVGRHRGGKMRFWRGKNPKICRKWLILAILSSNGGGEWGKSLRLGGGKCPYAPFDAATVYFITLRNKLWKLHSLESLD